MELFYRKYCIQKVWDSKLSVSSLYIPLFEKLFEKKLRTPKYKYTQFITRSTRKTIKHKTNFLPRTTRKSKQNKGIYKLKTDTFESQTSILYYTIFSLKHVWCVKLEYLKQYKFTQICPKMQINNEQDVRKSYQFLSDNHTQWRTLKTRYS